MSKHTPGPWFVYYGRPRNSRAVFVCHDDVAAGGRVAIAQAIISNEDANARLIAAAPDLLEALKALHAAVAASKTMEGREYVSLGIQVNDAIAKAEGR